MKRSTAGALKRGSVHSIASVTHNNALQAAQSTRPALKDLADLIKRFGEDTGSKRLKVGDIKTLGFVSAWENGVMGHYGTLKGEESDPGVNTVTVEHRPPWEQVIFMVRDLTSPVVAVLCNEVVAEMTRRGYARVDVNYYSSLTELPQVDAESSSSSGIESVAGTSATVEEVTGSREVNTNEDEGEDTNVTIPYAFPRIATAKTDPTAAEQIVNQFEVKHEFLFGSLSYINGFTRLFPAFFPRMSPWPLNSLKDSPAMFLFLACCVVVFLIRSVCSTKASCTRPCTCGQRRH